MDSLSLNSVSTSTEMTRQDAKCSSAKLRVRRSQENSNMRKKHGDRGFGWRDDKIWRGRKGSSVNPPALSLLVTRRHWNLSPRLSQSEAPARASFASWRRASHSHIKLRRFSLRTPSSPHWLFRFFHWLFISFSPVVSLTGIREDDPRISNQGDKEGGAFRI